MYDPHSREPRGFGFVTFETGEEADAALTELNGYELMGRALKIAKVSQPKVTLFANPNQISRFPVVLLSRLG